MHRAFVGTSGWQYAPFRERFYPPGLRPADQLPYYSRHLDTVEVNSTFYHFARDSTYERWRAATPPGFMIALKAHRTFTHLHRLRDPRGWLPAFLSPARSLGGRLGPILFQTPDSLEADVRRLRAFLRLLPSDVRATFELRHPSWWQSSVWRALEAKGAAFCIHDIRGTLSPSALTANFAYVRLHGPHTTPYFGAYPKGALETWATRIAGWRRETFVYFDNTGDGDAIDDAIRLRGLLSDPQTKAA